MTTESGGTCGHDAGKGIERPVVADPLGPPPMMVVRAADIRDRDGAPDLPGAVGRGIPWPRHVFADGGRAGDRLRDAMGTAWTLEIIG